MSELTVGIPFHKSADPLLLKKAIESVINQTYEPSLVHLIQDGEVTSEISSVVQEYSHLCNIEHIIFSENRGLASAINYSLKQADTKYYARMDADDISMPYRFERQFEYFENDKELDIVGSWATDINNNGKKLSLRKVPVSHEDIVKYIWTNPLIHPTVMFKRDSILRIGGYNEKAIRRQDYELWFRCVKHGFKMHNIPEPLLKYRFTEDYFKKNDAKVIWEQVKMGWKGCWLLKLPLITYIGVSIPLIKITFPKKIAISLATTLKKVDPRDAKTYLEGKKENEFVE